MSNRSNKARSTTPITLRSVRYSDAAFLYTLENDPQNWQWGTNNEAPYSIDQIENFCRAMESNQGRPDSAGQLRLIVELRENENGQHAANSKRQTIGTVDLYNCHPEAHTANVAILIYPEQHRTQGYGKAALSAFIDYARTMGLDRLTAEIDPKNEKSRNLFISCGFRLARTTPEGIMYYILTD